MWTYVWIANCILLSYPLVDGRTHYHSGGDSDVNDDITLWINKDQGKYFCRSAGGQEGLAQSSTYTFIFAVKLFSGYSVQIYAIDNGRVSPHLKDPNLNNYLPTIPSEVSYVNFTWSSGPKKYTYHFDRLTTSDDSILKPPTISIDPMGAVPKNPQGRHHHRRHPLVIH